MADHNNAQSALVGEDVPQQYDLQKDFHQRWVPNVPEPAKNKPTDAEFYLNLKDNGGVLKPDPTFLKEHFFQEGRLTEEQALFILERATEVLTGEPNLVDVKSPVTICGDIHGQYYDLMKLFEVGGSINDNSYLFLGDYVDRGYFGIECLLYLYTLKLWNPEKVVLLRGNHECRHLTEYFTFKRECLHKYSLRVYEACIQSFCALPITALVDGRFFCVHGGISPLLLQLSDLNKINRFTEPGNEGLICDLLWSDPIPNYGREDEPSVHDPVPPGTLFLPNTTRGCSFYFTYEASCKFLERNGLLGIIRGHEAQDEGYALHRKTPEKKFPSVITIFSAPNYLDVHGNRGAVFKYANMNITLRQYNSSPHPYWLPNFNNAFSWSLPFVGAKITEMLLAVLSVCSVEELAAIYTDRKETDMSISTPEEIQQMKNKIHTAGKMYEVFQILRQETEDITELAIGDVADEAGPSANIGLGTVLPDVLGVQGRNTGRTSVIDAWQLDLQDEQLSESSWQTSNVSPMDGENATVLAGEMSNGAGPSTNIRLGLGVQGAKIARTIKTFNDVRRLDMQNERLPELNPDSQPMMFSAPSLRRGIVDSDLEHLIKTVLEEKGEAGGTVERIAERIAKGMRMTRERKTKEAAPDKELEIWQRHTEDHDHLRRPPPGDADEEMFKAAGSLPTRRRRPLNWDLRENTNKPGSVPHSGDNNEDQSISNPRSTVDNKPSSEKDGGLPTKDFPTADASPAPAQESHYYIAALATHDKNTGCCQCTIQ